MYEFFPNHRLYEKPYRIMACSDSVITTTGYATCTKDIMNRLARTTDFEPIHLAYNFYGQPVQKGVKLIDGETLNFPIIGAGREQYCKDVMEHHIKNLNVDIFWILTDTFFMWPWFMEKNFAPAKSVFYYPSDGGGGLPSQNEKHDCINIIKKVDLAVAMSKFAQRQVEEVYGIKTPYIPIGVNTKKYYPFPKEIKEVIRERMTIYDTNNQPVSGSIMNGKFVIGSVFRNQPRKNASLFIETMKCMIDSPENKLKDFIFLLHTDPDDVAQTCDLRYLARKRGVADKLFFTGMKYYNGFSASEMNKLFNSFDAFYLPTSGEGWGMCCHPNTNIFCRNSIKKIKDLNIGDEVTTHRGHIKKIVKKYRRMINEELVNIIPYGNNEGIKITSNHPILAIINAKRKNGKQIIKSIPHWVDAGNLKKGDCVVTPTIQTKKIDRIYDLKDFNASISYDNEYLWYRMGFSSKYKNFSYSTLLKETGETKKIIENAKKCINNNQLPKTDRVFKIFNILKNKGYEKKEPNKIKRFIKLDDNLAYILGWYCAEGDSSNNRLEFGMHMNEIKYAVKIDKIINEKFGIAGNIVIHKEHKSLCLRYANTALANFFKCLCGKYAINKKIPEDILYNTNNIVVKFLSGLFLGDGHIEKNTYTLATISPILATQVYMSLIKVGLKPSKYVYKRKTKINQEYRISYSFSSKKNISHNNKSWFSSDGKYLYSLIREIKKYQYSGYVYNLEIEDDNSYVANTINVHNCNVEAMSCGIPCVVTDFTTTQEQLIENGICGIPIKVSTTMVGSWHVERAFADEKDGANALIKLINNPELCEQYGRIAREKCLKFYDYDDIIIPEWKKLLLELVEK